MDAIFVFDPSNDLVFVKTNKLFRSKIIKYSVSVGLLCEWSSASSSSYSSSINVDSASLNSADDLANTMSINNNQSRHKFRQFRQAHKNDEFMMRSLTDQSQEYQNIIMLLLTPYAASLRLASYNGNSNLPISATCSTSDSTDDKRAGNSKRLIGKNVGSIFGARQRIRRQQQSSSDTIYSGQQEDDDEDDYDDNDNDRNDHNMIDDFSLKRNKMTTCPPPIDCLKDCSVAYCERYEYIFIYMCQSSTNKTKASLLCERMMQKRIDIFARMSLLLFGASLSSMKRETRQALALRQLFDNWFGRQHDTIFLIEALERLIVSDNVKEACYQSMQSFLNIVRQSKSATTTTDETYTQAMLFSDTKLITSSSCRNCRCINKEDMLMIVMLLRVFNMWHNKPLSMSDEKENDSDEEERQNVKLNMSNESGNEDADDEDEYSGRRVSLCDRRDTTTPTGALCNQINCSHSRETTTVGDHSNRHLDDGEQDKDDLIRMTKQKCATSEPNHQCMASFDSYDKHSENSEVTYLSDYARSKHTNEIVMVKHQERKHREFGENENKTIPCYCCDYDRTKQTTLRRQRMAKKQSKGFVHSNKKTSAQPFPDSLLIFLSILDKSIQQSIMVPHMIRFISLTSGVTVVLISEVPTSTLGFHLNKILALLRNDSNQAPGGKINLNQVAKIGDSIKAMKEYFYSITATNESNEKKKSVQNLEKRSSLLLLDRSFDVSKISTFGTFDSNRRQKCESLFTKLEYLMSTIVHQYITQLVGLHCDNPKREALLANIRESLREAIDLFVIKYQLSLTDPKQSQYNQTQSEQINQAKLMLTSLISNYIDFLAIRSQCNINLGHPYTHDTLGLMSFVYIDRSRNECIISASSMKKAIAENRTNNDKTTILSSSEKDMKDEEEQLGTSPECSILSCNSSSTLTSDSTDESLGPNSRFKLKLPIHYSDSGYKSRRKYQKKDPLPKGTQRAEDDLGSFVSFIYNRLANGHSSFSSNHGLHIYSYFLWFEDTSGQPIMLQLKSKDTVFGGIREEYCSFPNVICDNFFDQLTRRVSSCLGQIKHEGDRTNQADGPKSESACKSEDRWPDFKGGGQDHRKETVVLDDRNQHEIMCFELFCVHMSSQIKHRRQILIDAKKLAARLWYLSRIKGA